MAGWSPVAYEDEVEELLVNLVAPQTADSPYQYLKAVKSQNIFIYNISVWSFCSG
jgi:hypothetical protein